MDLAKVSMQVRPRTPHEAADLGFVMARQWFVPLLLLAVVPTLPLMLCLFILFYDQPWWAVLILWWIKPLWETLQLQFLGAALFDPDVQWRPFLSQWRRHYFHHFFAKLLVQRWGLSRSFDMPVLELEQLQGQQRRQRLNILHRNTGSTPVWLTLLGNTVEGLLVLGLVAGAWLLVPVKMELDFNLLDLLTHPLIFSALAWGGWLAMMLVSPFYVAGGFMLYINRRIWLEAWDIELVFRQLAARSSTRKTLHSLLLPLLLLLAIPVFMLPAQSQAESLTPAQSQQQIIEILESDDFNQLQDKTELRWAKDTSRTDESGTGKESGLLEHIKKLKQWLQQFPTLEKWLKQLAKLPQLLETVLWGASIGVLVYLLFRFRHRLLPHSALAQPAAQKTTPTHLFGLELQPHSLPPDVLAQARQFWQQQKPRDALSLLYRAALSHLLHEDEIHLADSHTETEILSLCQQQLATPRAGYFQMLTHHWMTLAYAHQRPDENGFDQLCLGWPEFVSRGAAK